MKKHDVMYVLAIIAVAMILASMRSWFISNDEAKAVDFGTRESIIDGTTKIPGEVDEDDIMTMPFGGQKYVDEIAELFETECLYVDVTSGCKHEDYEISNCLFEAVYEWTDGQQLRVHFTHYPNR